jgi:DNA-binding transcriptional MerR regulator
MLRFVKQAKELGFTLDEIGRLIEASREQQPCALTRKLVERRLVLVEGELGRLRSLRKELKKLLDGVSANSAGRVCPLIEGR